MQGKVALGICLFISSLVPGISFAQSVKSISVWPTSITGGQSATAELTLSNTAGPNGFTVSLTSSRPEAKVPRVVVVPSGSSTIKFQIGTLSVSATKVAKLVAVANQSSASTTLEVWPPLLLGVGFQPTSIAGGGTAKATVQLSGTAPADGIVVKLSSPNPQLLVPQTVTIPSSARTASFDVQTRSVASATTVQVLASLGIVQTSGVLKLLPPTPLLTLASTSLLAGSSTTGTVTINAPSPTGGLTLSLRTSSPHVKVPSSLTVFQGQSLATFPLSTDLGANGLATITGTLGDRVSVAKVTVGAYPLASPGWPSDRGTIGRNGLSTGSGTVGVQKWFAQLVGTVSTSVSTGPNGTVYFGTATGFLCSVTPSGNLAWKFQTGGPIASAPTISSDGTVYVGSADANLYGVKSDGSMKWKFPTKKAVSSTPLILKDGSICFGSQDGNLYAVHPDGTLRWKFATGGPIDGSPIFGRAGSVIVGSEDGSLYSVSQDGLSIGSYKSGGPIHTSAAIGPNGEICFGSTDGNVYALSSDGTFLWKASVGSIESTPVISPEGTVYVVSGYLYALTSTGRVMWVFYDYLSKGGEFHSPALLQNGEIAVGTDKYGLYVLRGNGTIDWVFDQDGFANPVVQAANGKMYIGAKSGCLYAIGLNHRAEWRYVGSSSLSNVVVASDGAIYSGGSNGYLFCFNNDGTVRWVHQFGSGTNTSPIIGRDGSVYFGSNDGHLYGVNPNGTQKFAYDAGHPITIAPTIGINGTIFFELNYTFETYRDYYTSGATLVNLNPNGSWNWSQSFGGNIGSVSVGTDGMIYVGWHYFESSLENGDVESGALIAMDKNGSSQWSFGSAAMMTDPVVAPDGTVYVGSITDYLIGDPQFIYAISSTGKVKWTKSLDDPTYYGIGSNICVGPKGEIYYRDFSNDLFAVDTNGQDLWQTFAYSDPVIESDGTLIMSSYDGLTAIKPDGTTKWTIPLLTFYGSPAISTDGTVYIPYSGSGVMAIR